ncbi:hypothetical protein ZYGR_0AK01690 [Zygosaccharomyces rouxii]|uniref:Uncharacterized protein n=1 Tax=Zygosaccharomyces rouxii TaxID=4956 RepID=A0A1Q3AD64_ZYGRO|nr:hypothetical protein ZYGR_0AK01690 [Zygosaccharomyces rouxii]
MSWSNSISTSSSNRFKLKRAHSPESVGINNYKKQRLIQDFERLSLKDSSRGAQSQVVASNNNLLDHIGIDIISIPKDVKERVRRLRNTNTYNDEKLVYEKLREAIRNEHLQIIRWHDPLEIVYQQWLRWIQSRWVAWPAQPYLNDNDNDIYNYNNSYGGYDSDVDMDA